MSKVIIDHGFGVIETRENYNQDKILFVIEQLEKVKEDVKNVHIEDTQYDCYCYQETTRDKCVKIIDNQIEELKRRNKDDMSKM